jgi:hypothetical protein
MKKHFITKKASELKVGGVTKSNFRFDGDYWEITSVSPEPGSVNVWFAQTNNNLRRRVENYHPNHNIDVLEHETVRCDRCWQLVRYDEQHNSCSMLREVPVELLESEGFHKIEDQEDIERIQWENRTGTWEYMDFARIYVNSDFTRIYATPKDSNRTYLVCYR